MGYIQNINAEEVLCLAEQISVEKQKVMHKTLVQNKAVSLTLFAFDKNQEIHTHASQGDAMVTVLEGVGMFTIAGVAYTVCAGQTIVMPAKKPHAVFAKENMKMLLTVIFPQV